MRKVLATLMIGGLMAFGAPDAAEAQVVSGGLVNVTLVDVVDVGDVQVVVSNVAINVAANVAAQICGTQLNLGVLAQQVARQGQATACQIEQDGSLRNVQITRNRQR
jgi:hypothetical protein